MPRVPLLLVLAVPLPLLGVAACSGSSPPSRLQQRSEVAEKAPAKAPAPEPTKVEAKAPSPGSAGPGPLTGQEGKVQAEPPPGAELVSLRLALPEGAAYRITTIGNLQFGSMMQATAFAREERLQLSGCTGEGQARACTLEHKFVHFDAEPPAGQLLINDENEVRSLVTRHAIKASGERPGPTEIVDGPKELIETPPAKALAEVHHFACIRFPEQPIAVGAKWRATCHLRTGGVVDTRDVLWELDKIERDPDMGLRAELSYLGTYLAPGPRGTLEGVIRGTMYFFVDTGAPHLIREEFTAQADAASKFVTHTTLAYQFALLVPGKDGKETAVRVDGKPFPPGPPANATSPATPPSAPLEGGAGPG